ncbi:MAG: cofactor-independent phosphoglycerate mutase [Kiritimatiellae bacterium]|nr:cofactor-independent phosphoglycerate mutase [Kiritimatiellia bacterium]
MKFAVLVGDGMGDYPVESLGGKTPLQAAEMPFTRRAAQVGERLMLSTVPDNLEPGSDVANMSLLGYNPEQNYTGRAAIEAAGAGIPLKENDVAFRCNLVTVEEGRMLDYSAGHITSAEAAELIASLEEKLGRPGRHLHAGVSYRHLLVWENGPDGFWIEPPHEFTGKRVSDYLPSDADLVALLECSREVFRDHPVNRRRMAEGKHPATQIWLWGQGRAMRLPSYETLYGLRGGVVSAVDLVRGLGVLAGLDAPKIPGATGFLDTNVQGKVDAALRLLHDGDYVYLHLEAPDECGHMGDAQAKVQAIEMYDYQVVRPIWEALERAGEPYVMILCMDHRTPVAIKGHTREPVPVVIVRGPTGQVEGSAAFDETVNDGHSQGMAYEVIGRLLNENR